MGIKEDIALVKEADDHSAGTTEYESNALDSMLKRLDQGIPLTMKQRAWVEDLLKQMDRRGARSDN